jgi:hypothetical protein
LFVGSESGRLFKVQEAQSNAPLVTEIGSTSFPPASISSIAIGESENTLMVTFSNYGVASVWLTYNGGQSWQNIEGNLPDMPVRWAILHPQNNRQALIATETGVWECINPSVAPVTWTPVNFGMANVRVDMLQVRKSDNLVLAASHGRGIFTMTWDITTGQPEQKEETSFVFPNPSTGQIRVAASLSQPGIVTISVADMHGKQVYQETQAAPAGRYNKQINLETLPKGTYMVTLKNKNKTIFTRKTVIL